MIVFFFPVVSVLSVFWGLTGAIACTLETMHNRRGQRTGINGITGINCQSTMDHGIMAFLFSRRMRSFTSTLKLAKALWPQIYESDWTHTGVRYACRFGIILATSFIVCFTKERRQGSHCLRQERHGKTEAHKVRIQLLDDIPVSQNGISFVMFGCLVLQIDCKTSELYGIVILLEVLRHILQ